MATPKLIEDKDEVYIEGDIDSAISALQKAKTRLTRLGWTSLRVNLTHSEHPYCTYAYVKGSRIETAQEAEKREVAEAAMRERNATFERQQYEALKKKFEGQ